MPQPHRGLGRPVLLAFWLLAAFVLLNGGLAYDHTRRVYENGQALAAGYERRAVSARLLSLMRDAETGQRGFLLTGDESYLEPYEQATTGLEANLALLRGFEALGPDELALFARLRSGVADKMNEMEATIALRREQGFEAARAEVLTDRGRRAMLEIRAASAAVGELETKELERRAEQSRLSYRSALLARALATLVGLGLIYFAHRLNDRNAAERARHVAIRHEQAERFRVTLRSIGDAVIVTDAEARVRFMNPVAEGLTGWTMDWEGRPVDEIFRIQDEASGQPGRDPVGRVLREGKVAGLENHTELLRKSGEKVSIDDSAAPILDAQGLVTGVVLVFRDITQRRKSERLVQSQKQALEEGDRHKDEFLAVLAHELRNPLGALRNAAEVLRLVKGDSGEGKRARNIIERQVRQMARMVDDLIDIARISSGRMTLRRAQIEIREAVEAAVETTAPLFEERHHRLEIRLPPEPVFVDGDVVRIAQVLTNLLSNAAKFSEPGGHIRLEVSAGATTVTLLLNDNGMGIGAQLLPHVFDLFRQSHPSAGAAQGGLGIGLTLARRIVEMHGGTIEATSPGPNLGSTFVVTLPRVPLLGASPRPAAERERAPSAHRILVVEDNPDALQALESVLRLSGYEVRGLSGGAQALPEARGLRPTVALVDLGLPDVSGYEVARRLGAEPELAGLHLVAFTGWAQEADRQRSHQAGFTHHLVKPVEPERLLRLLASLPARVARSA